MIDVRQKKRKKRREHVAHPFGGGIYPALPSSCFSRNTAIEAPPHYRSFMCLDIRRDNVSGLDGAKRKQKKTTRTCRQDVKLLAVLYCTRNKEGTRTEDLNAVQNGLINISLRKRLS